MPTTGATKSGTPVVTQNATNYLWATQVLGDLGGPSFQTKTNVDNLVRWMTFEEPASTWNRNNNPLNVMTNGSNAASSTYPSLNAAAAGTASVIGQDNMKSIYNAFATSAPWQNFAQAVNSSPWGTSIQVSANQSLPPNVTASGQNLGGGGAASTSGQALPGTCGASTNQGTSLPLLGGHFGDACQLKALVGGLAVAGGGLVMIVGLVLIATTVASQSKLVKQVAANPTVNFATRGVSGAVSSQLPQARSKRREDARDRELEVNYLKQRAAIEERNREARMARRNAQGARKRAGVPADAF